ncbi:Type IV secretory pathway, VirB4 components [plant metagenome]|uniref:Type IV secretory pathway, VirB4 components n=1 Tax=plant metagenome TaxID=1297885 RepID=A0A484QMT1_9ZZZZ
MITKNPLLSPYVVKITKMWRKLGAWFWVATQNIDDLPKAAEPMLNMIEWWICLSMPPDEVEKIARFRELSPAKALMLSARKEAGKFTEGVILSKSMEVLFRAVPPSLYLALAQTEPEEKAERYQLMQQFGISELQAAFKVAEKINRAASPRCPKRKPLSDLRSQPCPSAFVGVPSTKSRCRHKQASGAWSRYRWKLRLQLLSRHKRKKRSRQVSSPRRQIA